MSKARSIRPRLGFAAALPLLLIPAILIGVATQVRQPTKHIIDIPEPPPEADYYIRDAQLSSMDENGHLLYRVNAANVLHYPDQSISMKEVEVSYLNGPWTLTAASGHIPPGEESLQLSGDVHMQGTLRSGEAVRLRTDDIRIRFADRLIDTQSTVHMNSDTVTATSTGLQTDMAGQELKLLSEVKVRYAP
ncbi:MAG: LPS export ABC transporter periplasmic protein LptC [Oceanococcus sp.]